MRAAYGVRVALLATAFALACARAPAGEALRPEDASELLRSACAHALASLDPERADAGYESVALPVELEPTVRALQGMGMGARVDALDAAVDRAALLALRDSRPWLEHAVAEFVPRTPLPAEDDSLSVAFRAAREAELRTQLASAASRALAESGTEGALESVRAGAQRLPLRRPVEVDLVSVVTERALLLFFDALAAQERSLRQQRETLRGGYGDPPRSGSPTGPEATGESP